MIFQTLSIRADANSRIGAGHVMRCIALGQAFKKLGGDVHFITACDIKAIESRIKAEGFKFLPISPGPEDPWGLRQTLNIIKNSIPKKNNTSHHWVVLDGYHFEKEFQQAIRNKNLKVMIIDDYNHQPFYYADLIVNQNIGAQTFQYGVDNETVVLRGLKYALIREEFTKTIPTAPRNTNKVLRILLTIGGSDPSGITPDIIKILGSPEFQNIKVKVAAGPANPMLSELKSLVMREDLMELVENGHMPRLMQWADLAITAAGSTCIELSYTGVPFLSIVTAANQESLARNFEKKGVSLNLGWFSKNRKADVTKCIRSFIEDNHKRGEMKHRLKALVDDQGPIRIIRQMKRISSNGS